MQGIIQLKSGTYIFRDDHAQGKKIWAWNIKNSYDTAKVHEWIKLLRAQDTVILFDLDRPPQTIGYQPFLN